MQNGLVPQYYLFNGQRIAVRALQNSTLNYLYPDRVSSTAATDKNGTERASY